jgi:nitrogen fixation/metabolism regulation signal transduction histidine kinase
MPPADRAAFSLPSLGRLFAGLRYDRRIQLIAVAASLPGSVTSLALLWTGDFTPKVQWTLTAVIVGVSAAFAASVRSRVMTPLQTLSNLLAALREEDYSIRARGAAVNDALGEVMIEVNALGQIMRERRLGALDAIALLRTVMSEIDVAVFSFDPERRLQLVNRAGERLLGQPAERVTGSAADALGLEPCLTGDAPRILEAAFPGGAGRWDLRRGAFWQGGRPYQLVVLTDLSRPLRQEERQAWQRLIRVIGHELNNSLAPIRSLAGSLETLLHRRPRPADWEEDMRRGLAVIAARSDSLSRFMEAYARLARLPPPRVQPIDLRSLVQRAAAIETRLGVVVQPGRELTVHADGDQLEQLLINLIRNGVDAALESGGGVRISWRSAGGHVEVAVEDDGPGLPDTGNLFVPFFTTKPGGSGIGLVLCRQIAEGHGGSLSLENRGDRRGARALVRLPLAATVKAEAAAEFQDSSDARVQAR